MQGYPRACRAFTIIELLVVVGIIMVLIAILVPSLMYVRVQAQKADTIHQMASIKNAIDRYYADFNDAPGPIAETDVAGNNGVTAGQNLVLGLMGFLWDATKEGTATPALPAAVSPYPSGWITIPSLSAALPMCMRPGIGPTDYRRQTAPAASSTVSAAGVDSKYETRPAYYTPRAGELRLPTGTAAMIGVSTAVALINIPVLYDRFTDSLPFLYWRGGGATYMSAAPAVNAAGVWATRDVVHDNAADDTSKGKPAVYYRLSNAAFYNAVGKSTGLMSGSGIRCPQDASGYARTANGNNDQYPQPAVLNGVTYGTNTELLLTATNYAASSSTVLAPGKFPRGKYVLISAGIDRIYGPRLQSSYNSSGVWLGNPATGRWVPSDDLMEYAQ